MSKQFLKKKKQRVMRDIYFILRNMRNEKRAAPPTFLCWRQLFTPPLYETNFPDDGGHSITHSIFETCVQ